MLGRVGRRDMFALAALGLAGIGIPLWMSAAAGAIGIASNDDWVYMRGAESLFRTGSIDMPGHTASAIGQVVMVQPLLWLSGGNAWAFTAFGLVMALIGLGSAYLLARRFVGAGPALMVALLLVTFPGFARQSAGFMTDVPAFAFAMLCLLLGTRWLQGEGRRATLVAALAVGVLGVSIRESVIAAPVVILVAGWARNRADERAWLTVASVLLAVAVTGVLLFAATTAGKGLPLSPNLWRLTPLAPLFTTLAAVLLPAAALAMGRRMVAFSPGLILAAVVVVLAMFVQPAGPIVGQFWSPDGLVGNALLNGPRDPVIGPLAWAMTEQLALFAGILVAALTLRWGRGRLARVESWSTGLAVPIRIARSREGPLVLFLFAYAAELIAFSLVSYPLDRYLYPMVPVAAILLLRGPMPSTPFVRSQAFSQAALVWLAVSAFAITSNSFAYDAARERAGEAAVAMGFDARTVDAGYDWVGAHASGRGNPGPVSYGAAWYDDMLMWSRPCAVLSNSPMEGGGFRLIRVDGSAYRQYLFLGPYEPLYLYGAQTEGCPQPPAASVAGATP